MDNGRQKGWRELESTEDAARRLLAVLDERSKRETLAGSVRLGPAEIADQPAVSPAEAEKGGGQNSGANSVGSAALKSSGRQSTHAEGRNGSDHTAKVLRGDGSGLEMKGGRATFSGCEPVSFEVSNGRTRPITPDFAVGTDRANRYAPEDGE